MTRAPKRRTREETKSDNDALLLKAGRKLFLAHGFHAASLDQVSAAAGLTKGAVYARFESKAALFLALLQQHVTERLTEMRAASASVKSPLSAARAVARQWLERTEVHRDWALLTLEFRVHAARDPALLARYRTVHEQLRSGIVALVQEVYERAGIEPPVDPETWARLALALGNGIAAERWADEHAPWPQLFERLLVGLARDGLPEKS